MSLVKEIQQEFSRLNKVVSWPALALIGCGLVAAFFLSFGGLSEVVERWIAQEEYSHGFLIPLVSLYILWEKRLTIAVEYRSGSWWGCQ